MHFKCCNVYIRIYVNKDETAYEGRCPKCGAPVRIAIAPDGSSSRFWSAE